MANAQISYKGSTKKLNLLLTYNDSPSRYNVSLDVDLRKNLTRVGKDWIFNGNWYSYRDTSNSILGIQLNFGRKGDKSCNHSQKQTRKHKAHTRSVYTFRYCGGYCYSFGMGDFEKKQDEGRRG